MHPDELRELIAVGYEQGGIEFKPPCDRRNKEIFARVVRAVLGMANRRDGGKVVVGVLDENRVLTPMGLTSVDLATWNLDDVMAAVSPYADPFVELDLRCVEMDGMLFVVLDVASFQDVPVLCAREYEGILRPGACYVRSRRKPETSEVPSQSEMRELLDIAIDKGVRKFLARAHAAGLRASALGSDTTEFDDQVRDLL